MSIKAWDDDQEATLIKMYVEDDIKDVQVLAKHFGKGYRSVISKLVQLRIYVKPEVIKEDKIETVKVMLRELKAVLALDEDITNLNKKDNLAKLLIAIKNRLEIE